MSGLLLCFVCLFVVNLCAWSFVCELVCSFVRFVRLVVCLFYCVFGFLFVCSCVFVCCVRVMFLRLVGCMSVFVVLFRNSFVHLVVHV